MPKALKWRRGSAVPPPQKIFCNFSEIVHFDAFWGTFRLTVIVTIIIIIIIIIKVKI